MSALGFVYHIFIVFIIMLFLQKLLTLHYGQETNI